VTGSPPAGVSAAVPVGLLLVAAPLAASAALEGLFAATERVVVPADTLRVSTSWEGPLFALFDAYGAAATGEERPRAGGGAAAPPPLVGLAVPVVWTVPGPAPDLVLIADHVNLTLRGPLSGRRPPSGSPVFPSMTGIYQPSQLRRAVAGRVYSEVAVAGVTDAARLTPFEWRSLHECACPAVSDCLVDAVIVAAYRGLHVAACGIPQRAMES
jgi:hypothetical protein